MKDLIRERLKNQGVALTRAAAKMQREPAPAKRGHEWACDRTAKPKATSANSRQLKQGNAG